MKRITSGLLNLALFALLLAPAAASADDKKANPVGTWTWSTPGRDGGPARESTLKLAMEGDKLAGSITGGRGGEVKIENAKLAGDELTFDVKREFNGNTMITKYKGKLKGDEIVGKAAVERDGETRERDWTAKRKTESAAKEEKKS